MLRTRVHFRDFTVAGGILPRHRLDQLAAAASVYNVRDQRNGAIYATHVATAHRR
ncbi:MAG: hypothetical protein ACREA0_03825 [bacterium]